MPAILAKTAVDRRDGSDVPEIRAVTATRKQLISDSASAHPVCRNDSRCVPLTLASHRRSDRPGHLPLLVQSHSAFLRNNANAGSRHAFAGGQRLHRAHDDKDVLRAAVIKFFRSLVLERIFGSD